MRKIALFYLLLFASLILVSCSNEPGGSEVDFTAVDVSGEYYGDLVGKGNGCYKLIMVSEASATRATPGEKLETVMILSSKLAFVPFNIALPDGEYSASATGEALTFEAGVHIAASNTYTGSYYKHTDVNGVVTMGPIVDGKFTSATKDAKTTVKAEFTSTSGKSLEYKYEKSIAIKDLVEYDAVFTYNNTEFPNVQGYYWGQFIDEEETGSSNVGIFTTLMVSGTPDEWGELEGAGYELVLDSYSDLADYACFAEITTGTYKVDYTGALYTGGGGGPREGLDNYYGASYLREVVPGDEDNEIMHYVTGGSYNVLVDGEHYYFLMDLVTDKMERFTAKFEGVIKFSDEVTLSSLREDLVMPATSFDKGYMQWYWSSEDEKWEILLLGNGMTVGPEGIDGIGRVILLSLRGTPGIDAVEAGVYPVSDTKDLNIALRGTGFPEWGEFYDSWFIELDMMEWEDEDTGEIEEYLGYANYAPIHIGEVRIDKEGNVYTITIEATDDYPNKILATYSGELLFDNGEEALAPMLANQLGKVRASSYKLPQVVMAKGAAKSKKVSIPMRNR